nr:hemocyanin A-type, units Ode to Odg-like isoform X1 [Ciona intestinalis]|eukprot:XP_026690153.1 hemocyanin A-type, units Ode to Odg-like isoform X1 [Ciona intestinalis]
MSSSILLFVVSVCIFKSVLLLVIAKEHKPNYAVTFDKEKLKSNAFLPVINGVDCDMSTDRTYCWVNCEQDQVGYSDHCCRCVCRRGFALGTDRRSCIRVSWTPWESWTPCLSTEWGGLETRSRRCRTKHATDATGRCVGAGSQSRTCSRITKTFIIRKNIRSLTEEETFDILQALARFKQDNSTNGYTNIISWHGWPYRCPWNKKFPGHKDGHCSWHTDLRFCAWHRLITLQLEMGLNKYLRNKTLGIPYWDWTESDWDDIPFYFRNITIHDPYINQTYPNPFNPSVMPGHKPINGIPYPVHAQRGMSISGLLASNYMLRGTIRSLLANNYQFFDLQLEQNPHNQIHVCFCNETQIVNATSKKKRCHYGMPTTPYAAWDPAFLLHHSQMDRLYALYRLLREKLGIQDWTQERMFHGYKMATQVSSTKESVENLRKDVYFKFNMPLSPFCNVTMNPNHVTGRKGTWTTAGSYHFEQLFGYRYDNFNLDRKPWQVLLADMKLKFKRPNWDEDSAPFVSLLKPSLGLITNYTSYPVSGTKVCVGKNEQFLPQGQF